MAGGAADNPRRFPSGEHRCAADAKRTESRYQQLRLHPPLPAGAPALIASHADAVRIINQQPGMMPAGNAGFH